MRIIDLFNKIFNRNHNKQNILTSGDQRYSQLVESIDGKDLSKRLIGSITPEVEAVRKKYAEDFYGYPLQTKISVSDTRELVKKFFSSINPDLYKWVCDIDADVNPYAKLDKNYQGIESCVTNPNQLPVAIRLPVRGDLRQVYEAVHELTHTFDIKRGDTATRRVLGEIASQCMERLLDDFLLNLSDEDIKKYGFDRNTLEQDIIDRKLSTFFDRLRMTELIEKNEDGQELHLRYMLAQIYSSHIEQFGRAERIDRLKTFIEFVENDDFDGANNSLGMQIKKDNKLQRDNYIRDTISVVDILVKPEHKVDIEGKEELEVDELNK